MRSSGYCLCAPRISVAVVGSVCRVVCTPGQSSSLRSLVAGGATVVVAADTHAQQQVMHDSEASWKVGQTVMVLFEGEDHIGGVYVGQVNAPHTHTYT